MFVVLNLIEFNLTSAAGQTLQGQGSKCCLCSERHPDEWSLGISSHSWNKTWKHSVFVDSCLPDDPFYSLWITLGTITTGCLLLDPDRWFPISAPGTTHPDGVCKQQSHHNKPHRPHFFGWFCRLLLLWRVSKSTDTWIFHAGFGKVLAKHLTGSAPGCFALVGHLRRFCRMS